jgi:hypothetical protein
MANRVVFVPPDERKKQWRVGQHHAALFQLFHKRHRALRAAVTRDEGADLFARSSAADNEPEGPCSSSLFH